MIEINEPKTLVLSPNALSHILDALADKPFRIAQPIIEEIITQLKPKEPQNEQPAASSRGPIPTTLSNSNDGSSGALNGAGLWSNGAGPEVGNPH